MVYSVRRYVMISSVLIGVLFLGFALVFSEAESTVPTLSTTTEIEAHRCWMTTVGSEQFLIPFDKFLPVVLVWSAGCPDQLFRISSTSAFVSWIGRHATWPRIASSGPIPSQRGLSWTMLPG